LFNYTINDEWPYFNTSESYNFTDRIYWADNYTYTNPATYTETNYYTRPSYLNAWCSKGADDVQHNQFCLFDYTTTEIGTASATPGGAFYDSVNQRTISSFGIEYDIFQLNSVKWWTEFTIDRLFSERWFINIPEIKWGIRIAAFLWYPPEVGALCLNLGLFSDALTVYFQR